MSYSIRKYNRKFQSESFRDQTKKVVDVLIVAGYDGTLPEKFYKVITSTKSGVDIRVDGYGRSNTAYLEKFLEWDNSKGAKTSTVTYWKTVADANTNKKLIPFAIDPFGGYFAVDVTTKGFEGIVFVSGEHSDESVYEILLDDILNSLSIK